MNSVIKQIYSSGYVEDAQGNKLPHGSSPVTFETGQMLYDFIRAARPAATLEIGMAYGLSALFICQAHCDNGAGHHTSIDPFEQEVYKSIGLLNLERADLRSLLRFFNAPSHEVLPQFCTQGERFDFAFIDGSHFFDYVLVDFFYIDRLLDIGGHIAFDDLWMPGVRKAISFILRNRSYRLVRSPSNCSTPAWRHMLMTGRRIVQNPLGRDWRLKFIPQNVAFIEKVAVDNRKWEEHRAF